MSILSRSDPSPNMTARTPSFREFKKQASFFLRETIKSARLALTDVTHAELLVEEAVGGNSPDLPTLHRISRAAFEIGEFWRIVEFLRSRLARFDKSNWRSSYNSLVVLEHLLTHGPESIADEFQSDKDVIALCATFQYIDEKGFNWGLAARNKSDRILKLLEKGPLLREERDRSRKLKRGIQGFGSFCDRTPITQSSRSPLGYGRCNSQFNPENQEDEELTKQENTDFSLEATNAESQDLFEAADVDMEEQRMQSIFTAESKPLLVGKLDDSGNYHDWEYDHPFNDHQNSHSLLAGGN